MTGRLGKGATKNAREIGHWRSFMSGALIISLATYVKEIILSKLHTADALLSDGRLKKTE
jgi:hypothetical protein